MTAKDVLPQNLRLELLSLDIETREPALGVRDEDPAIRSTLHRTEHTRTSGSPLEANIEHSLEGTAIVLLAVLGQLVFTISLGDALERLVKAELGEGAAGKEETGSVGGSPVGETVLDPVAGELVGVGSRKDLVAGDL